MKTEDIKKQLKEVEDQINSLEETKKNLIKQLSESKEDFAEKFNGWYEFGKKGSEDYMISEEDYPLLRKHFDKMFGGDYERNKTYYIFDYLDDDLQFLIDPEGYESWIEACPEDALTEEKKAELIELAKEIMDNNIEAFTYDC